jgi:hypothetical protein
LFCANAGDDRSSIAVASLYINSSNKIDCVRPQQRLT